MSQGGGITSSGGGGSGIQTIDGNTGSVTGTTVMFDGGPLGEFSGSGTTMTFIPGSNAYPITPYVVGPAGKAGYQTIQSAINAANSAGGGFIFVQNGTYVEDLTLFPDISISGPQILSGYPGSPSACVIEGNHIPATSGSNTFNNITFITPTGDAFASSAAGTAELNFTNAGCGVTDGYFLNLPNWTGIFSFWDFNPSLGTNDGGINNPTGGASTFCYEAGVGLGTTRTMQISGLMIFNQGEIMCPVQFNSGSDVLSANNIFGGTMTLAGNSTITSHHSYHDTAATAAITMSSSGACSFFETTIDSSNNPAIAGAGAGALTLGDITFTSNTAIAGTLTLSTTGALYPPGNLGTAGFVWTSNGPGVAPTFQASGGGGSVTLTGDTGTASGANITLSTGADCGGTVLFAGDNASTMDFNVTDVQGNTFIGSSCGISGNFGDSCTGLGSTALASINNTSFRNTGLGYATLFQIVSGDNNLAVGANAGSALTGADAGNIMIAAVGVAGDANTTRIGYVNGTASTITSCFIDGINGATVTGTAVLCSTDGQLGTVVSSERFKENIKSLGDDSSKILELNPVSFSYKTDEQHNKCYGLIAEEVQKIFPELVIYDSEQTPHSVKYHEMPAILLNELIKLSKKIEQIESIKYEELTVLLLNEIKKLNERIVVLENRRTNEF